MRFLLDTSIISEVRRANGSASVKQWLASVPSSHLYLSVLVIGEIRRGTERLRRRDPARAIVLEAGLIGPQHEFADRILPVSTEGAEEWGRLNVPDPIPVIDGMLAATARVHGLTLVTRNVADVSQTGVRVLNLLE